MTAVWEPLRSGLWLFIMGIRRATAQALATALALTAVSPALSSSALGATAADLFYERAVMSAANGDCHLFDPDVGAALDASLAQARGAALRSGMDPAGVDALSARASATATAAGCASPDIAIAAQRVRDAFAGYARLDSMDFPSDLESWTAIRPGRSDSADVATADRWRVVQTDRFGWDELKFGVVGHGEARVLTAVATFADGAQPYGARLVLRDAGVTNGPFLDPREADIHGVIPIAARLPPRAMTRVFNADDMAPASPGLASPGAQAWSFSFPAEAMNALTALDPREAVAVEFLMPGDDSQGVRTAYVEVGDFAAARAFQQIAQR